MYQLIHLGGETCVTGSCHLLRLPGLTIMVDCGLSQGHDSLQPMEQWPVAPSNIDYLFLTHAHIDHIGRVPELVDNGFHGEIICSHPTKALLLPMLTDAMGFSRIKESRQKSLATAIDALSWGFEYNETFFLKNKVRFTLGRAGHILGSCFIHFELSQDEERPFQIVFSGDLGCRHTPLLPDPDPPPTCDLLVLESTYGNRSHESREHRIERLEHALGRALDDGGKVFIPAFALGRTQELLCELDAVFAREEWKERHVPVFVDSPLALEITEVYARLAPFWDKECRARLAGGDHPFDFSGLYRVERFRDHRTLLDIPGPAVIIAGSGMCSGGRIIDHLKQGLSDPKNDIFFVGYQAEGTPGRDIATYGQRPDGYVRLNGEKIPIRARVEQLSGYSAHADQQGLLDWVASMPEKPGRIKLVHGGEEARAVLRRALRSQGYTVAH